MLGGQSDRGTSQSGYAVANGQLWIRRDVLDLYVKRTRNILHDASVSDKKLTTREMQILNFLQQDCPNKDYCPAPGAFRTHH